MHCFLGCGFGVAGGVGSRGVHLSCMVVFSFVLTVYCHLHVV